MEYNKIISVTGLGGLYELLGSKSDGAIVKSLEDKTTKFASSRSHHFSHLETIEVYTIRENVNLLEVFKAMKNSTETLPDYKDLNAVKKYFEKVFPEMDFERVYSSDLKKMVRWYQILEVNQVDFEKAGADELKAATINDIPEVEQKEETEPTVVKKVKKKAATAVDKDAETEEKPKKKAVVKKPKTD